MLERLGPLLWLVLIATHAPQAPAAPHSPAPAGGASEGADSPDAWILFQNDAGDSVIFDGPWPEPESRLLKRTTYRFSVRSGRGVAIVVREFTGDPASVPTAPPAVDSLLAFRRGMDALNLAPDQPSQVVILPASWYRFAAIRVPDQWLGLTAWFFFYGDAVLPRSSGQLVRHVGPYRPASISPDVLQARHSLQYPSEALLRTARPLGGVLLEAEPNGSATDVKDLEDD